MTGEVSVVERLRAFCLMLPEATEVEIFGSTTFRIATTAFAMFEERDGHAVITVKAPVDAQQELVAREGFDPDPETGRHGWTNIRPAAGVDWDEIDALIVESYRLGAPDEMLAALEALLREDQESPSRPSPSPSGRGFEVPEEPGAAISDEHLFAPVTIDEGALQDLDPRAFVQVIELHTREVAEVVALVDRWVEVRAQGPRGRSRLLRDWDREDVYYQMLDFSSLDDSMRNQALEATQELADRLADLCTEPPTFRNLEVLRDRTI